MSCSFEDTVIRKDARSKTSLFDRASIRYKTVQSSEQVQEQSLEHAPEQAQKHVQEQALEQATERAKVSCFFPLFKIYLTYENESSDPTT